ncbi:MAG: assembly factor cbp4 [Piccolia ochrophora]|nr:MAG: assembly factor cbp4 [Piccolia ochrophora]
MPGYGLWAKMFAAGTILCIGGPALVMYVTPTEDELFQRYTPERQKRVIETRGQREQDFDDFVTKLKEYSKSEKPIWVVAKEEEKRKKAEYLSQQRQAQQDETAKQKAEIKRSLAERAS